MTEANVLGITITSNLTWDVHVGELTRKADKRLFLLLQHRYSHDGGVQSDLERVQRRAMNIIYLDTPYTDALALAQLVTLKERRTQLCEHFLAA